MFRFGAMSQIVLRYDYRPFRQANVGSEVLGEVLNLAEEVVVTVFSNLDIIYSR